MKTPLIASLIFLLYPSILFAELVNISNLGKKCSEELYNIQIESKQSKILQDKIFCNNNNEIFFNIKRTNHEISINIKNTYPLVREKRKFYGFASYYNDARILLIKNNNIEPLITNNKYNILNKNTLKTMLKKNLKL